MTDALRDAVIEAARKIVMKYIDRGANEKITSEIAQELMAALDTAGPSVAQSDEERARDEKFERARQLERARPPSVHAVEEALAAHMINERESLGDVAAFDRALYRYVMNTAYLIDAERVAARAEGERAGRKEGLEKALKLTDEMTNQRDLIRKLMALADIEKFERTTRCVLCRKEPRADDGGMLCLKCRSLGEDQP